MWHVGCSPSGGRELKLTGTFEPAAIIYESTQASISLTLNIRNEGSAPLRILGVDGGCACRRVDHAGLPALIKAGAGYHVPVNMAASSSYGIGQYLFSAQTSEGVVNFPVQLALFPRNRVSPASIGLPNLIEEEEREFEIVHRSVFESQSGLPRYTLEVPPGFVYTRAQVQRGHVAAISRFEYQDTTYRVTLKDRSIGLRKSFIGLTRDDGQRELEVPVVWRRVEYLSAVPERAFLGTRASEYSFVVRMTVSS